MKRTAFLIAFWIRW